MGRPKQLLPLGDRPVIRHCVDALIAAGVRDIVVVAGEHHAELAEILRDTPARIVRNENQGSQMADSVRIGLRSIDDRYSGVLVCPSDHPLITAETYKAVLGRHREEPDCILIPSYCGKRGHPGLFPLRSIRDIFFSETLLDIINNNEKKVRVFGVPDEGVILNMNTEEDYRGIAEKFLLSRIAGRNPARNQS
jgi:molybdenum cofactor cytidylyltransferase